MSAPTGDRVWTSVALGRSDSRERIGVDHHERLQRHTTADGLVGGVRREEREGYLHESGSGSDG